MRGRVALARARPPGTADVAEARHAARLLARVLEPVADRAGRASGCGSTLGGLGTSGGGVLSSAGRRWWWKYCPTVGALRTGMLAGAPAWGTRAGPAAECAGPFPSWPGGSSNTSRDVWRHL